MNDFGIQTFRANGSVAIDSTNKAGVYIETLTVYGATSGAKVYSDVPAGYLYYLLVASDEAPNITVDSDGSGHSRISWTSSIYGTSYQTTTLLVFARRVNSSTTFGAAILNASGDYLADLNYPVPQFKAGTFSNGDRNSPISVGGGGYLTEATYNSRSDASLLYLMYLPDSTNDNLWYSFNPFSGASKQLKVYVYDPTGASYKLPSVHGYSLSAPVSAGASVGIQCFNASGALTYDSSSENIAIKDTGTVPASSKQNYVTVNSLTLAMPAKCGVAAPFYKQKFYTDSNNPDHTITEYWLSLYQRKGNTFYYQVKLVSGNIGVGGTYAIIEGTIYGGGIVVADISQLSPSPSIFTATGVIP